MLDDGVADLAEADEPGEEADDQREQPGHRLLDAVGGGADRAGGDRGDRVDERVDDLARSGCRRSTKNMIVL